MQSFNSGIDKAGIGMTSLRTRKRLVENLKNSGIRNQHVLAAMTETPRHLFIDEAMAHQAYNDMPVPIGYGQTISQPYIVGKMTEALIGHNERLKKVLEIGTGSGYQAAVLSCIAESVYTIERIKGLYELSRSRFRKLRLNNIYCEYDDGATGWLDHAPFDGIMVTCAAKKVPEELLQQLMDGGRLIIPVETDGLTQQLQIITKTNNSFNTVQLDLVRFVPMLDGKE